ncbi:iron-siderophore ABC transporter substrate-binding protein [Sporosarcina sp. G11-34]|uniref:iron-siderophore ABC transporter substrate-binding protein n=1 Tax=Sporosarcina sp. G11-34 TaxID=2849605 RepID=UPI0022A98F20|nr:iron-siderophore ABC transporter substrate-binding protein [Sporosarcina sp. G11-34]MCZ2259149.1 iron-siderophore ABC transporter substrate-binding protein [Sporosarcina sp. G11-34]
MKAKRKISLSILFVSAMILLFGCSADKPNSTSTGTADTKPEETTSKYPLVIEHAFGETVIEEKPERIATIAWGNHDVALALGVVPVGLSAANYGVEDGNDLLPWTANKLKELGGESPVTFQDTDGLDFEAISDANPDVILAAYSGLTQEEYDTLSEIAPVVAYQTSPWLASWREQVTFNSKGMGMEEEGKQLIADTEKLIQDKVNEYPVLKGKKAAFVSISATDLSKFYIYTPTDSRGEFLGELGMEYPENITSQITDPNSFYLELSAENADILSDVDLFVSYGDDNTLKALQADPILGKVPAVQRGSVAIIGDNTPLAAAGTPNPLAIDYSIDEYLTLLSEAANKVK